MTLIMTEILQKNLKFLGGVGPKKAALLLSELQLETCEDLLHYYPYKYIDKSKFYRISDLNNTLSYVQLKGQIIGFKTVGEGKNKRLTAQFSDDSGTIELVWFKGISWIVQNYSVGTEYVIYGKPTLFNNKLNISHPEIEDAQKVETEVNATLEASYNTTEKMKKSFLNSKNIRKMVHNILQLVYGHIPEILPKTILEQLKLISLNEAIKNIHFPVNQDILQKAIVRLKFDELFFIQLSLLKQKTSQKLNFKGYKFEKVGELFMKFYNENLPFSLTNAQKRVLKEIRHDYATGKHSNRLLQGDVGSGKTLVALMSMLLAIDNGFQAAIVAPTEILANQHYISIKDFLKNLGVNVEILTGSSKQKHRKILHEKLLTGEIHILVGTHALLEDIVQFKNLGLVVIDEQHRFGVAQRAKMWGKNTNPPHILVMTATPIPRTLAMTVYGDLDISVIDELPPGRKPIQTIHSYDSKRLPMFNFLKKQIAEGRQIYIVYPLIKESEKMDYKDLEDGYESITRYFQPPQYAVSVLHGKMKTVEKEKAMQLFVKGQTQIMVATTVIEVGVNVPNASVMVIESAERFGLSQLHQLRGRVGRGADQSYCILMTSFKLSAESKKRIKTMVDTNDGFVIAEADLQLRGPGDIEGTQQSGIPFNLRIANLAQDGKLLQISRNIATDILHEDPKLQKPEHAPLLEKLKKMKKETVRWDIIS